MIVDPFIHAPMGEMRYKLQSLYFDGLFSNRIQETNNKFEHKYTRWT